MGRAQLLAALAVFCCALGATEQLRSGQWQVITKENAPHCESPTWANADWTGVSKGEGQALITMLPPTGDVGRPAKFILMFGNADAASDWTGDAEKVGAWWNCKGEGQWGWTIECAFDVLQILDTNASGAYKLWVCLETVDGKRYPYYGASPVVNAYKDSDAAKLNPSCIRLPADYKWGKANSRAGATKASLKEGSHAVIQKANAPAFEGSVWAFEGWVWEPVKVDGTATLIQWQMMADDPCAGPLVRFLLYFGDPGTGASWYPNPGKTRDWFECKGAGQWSWYIECAPDVTQCIDPNGGKYLCYVAAEYESGKRVPLYGDLNAKGKKYDSSVETAANAIRIADGYKWPGGAPKVEAGKPVWQELGGAKRVEGDLKPGSYRVLTKKQVGEYKGNQWSADKWRGHWVSRRTVTITWAAAADDGDNKAVKFILLFSKELTNSPNWYFEAPKVKNWFECKGQDDKQQDWLIECAPDVTQLLELNGHLSYYVWIAVEYSDGKRYPWFKDDGSASWPKVESYDVAKMPAVQANCLKMYEDHQWAGQLRNESDLKSGEYRIVTKDNAKAFTGPFWSHDKFYGKMKSKGRQETLSWPTCSDDLFGNKAVKFIVYFGNRNAQKKWHADSSLVKKWFDLQGQAEADGLQYDWCLEVAPDVTQLLDTYKDSDYMAWVVVEYSNGKRAPFFGYDFPQQAGYNAGDALRKHVVKIDVTPKAPK
ncbi:MAG: hypothetical protein IT461_01360 [Planctomycetes bacterium]|nr:hypothetical protein [Planctomycetota bacterium]